MDFLFWLWLNNTGHRCVICALDIEVKINFGHQGILCLFEADICLEYHLFVFQWLFEKKFAGIVPLVPSCVQLVNHLQEFRRGEVCVSIDQMFFLKKD